MFAAASSIVRKRYEGEAAPAAFVQRLLNELVIPEDMAVNVQAMFLHGMAYEAGNVVLPDDVDLAAFSVLHALERKLMLSHVKKTAYVQVSIVGFYFALMSSWPITIAFGKLVAG